MSFDGKYAFWAAAPKGWCPVEHRGEFRDVRPSVHPSVRPSIRPSIRPSVHPPPVDYQGLKSALPASPSDMYWVLYRFYNTRRYWVYPILPINFVKNTIQYDTIRYNFCKNFFVGMVYKLMIMKDKKNSFDKKNSVIIWSFISIFQFLKKTSESLLKYQSVM